MDDGKHGILNGGRNLFTDFSEVAERLGGERAPPLCACARLCCCCCRRLAPAGASLQQQHCGPPPSQTSQAAAPCPLPTALPCLSRPPHPSAPPRSLPGQRLLRHHGAPGGALGH